MQPGDSAAWAALLARLDGLDDEACRSLAPRLAGWSDAVREVPAAWIARAIAGAPPAGLQLCRSLSLAHRGLDAEDAEEIDDLLRHPWLAGLTRLTLGMDARSLTAARLAGLAALQELRVETTEAFTSALRDEQLAEIAGCPALGCLRLLALEQVQLRGAGVAALARSPTLTGLTTLELYAPATVGLCKALVSAPALRGVQRLGLCADGFTVAAAGALARADELLVGLTELEFRVDESGGFDWAEPFTGAAGARNVRRFVEALARLLPALRDCEVVTIVHRPAGQVGQLCRADFARLAGDRRALRARLPPRLAGGR